MMKPMEAMIRSKTQEERDNPDIIDGSRRKRIAKGAGREVTELNALLREFTQMRQMMSQMMNMGPGMMKGMRGAPAGAGAPAGMPGLPARRGGAFNQKAGMGGDDAKMKPKHRRKQKTKKKKK